MARPLAGVRVIDLTGPLPGSLATLCLADLGADVIKVECPPEGDFTRRAIPLIGEASVYFLATCRNKRSACIDYRTNEGRSIVYDLVRRADVFVEGARPGSMGQYGLDFDSISKANPRIVYCSITGYGQDSSSSSLPAHGANIEFSAGLGTVEDTANGLRMTHLLYVSALMGGYNAALGICACLLQARESGKGRQIDVSMWDSAVTFDPKAAMLALNGMSAEAEDLGSPSTPKHAVYRTSDNRVLVLTVVLPHFWKRFCLAAGREDLLDRHSAAAASDLGQHDPGLYDEIAVTIREKPLDEWIRIFSQADVPASPVNSLREALMSEQGVARAIACEIRGPGGESIHAAGPALVIDGQRGKPYRMPPRLGEHTAEILREIGYFDTEVDHLAQTGTINVI